MLINTKAVHIYNEDRAWKIRGGQKNKKSSHLVNFLPIFAYKFMKVHLIRRESIEEYVAVHARSRSSFTVWLGTLKGADWRIPGDIQKTFASADLLGKSSSRVVFDIGGNEYGLIGKYAFGEKQVHLFVCWIGSHAEYSKLCKAGKQYTVANY